MNCIVCELYGVTEIKYTSTYDPAIPLLNTYPTEMDTCLQKDL